MAKILFIVNEHPNEAFAISVARETAKMLRAKGHEIIWNKMEFKETMLGKIFKNLKIDVDGVQRLVMRDTKERRKRTRKLIKEYNPDFTYRFHCTPSLHWHNTDFKMTLDKRISKTPSILVELRAYFKKLPRHLRFSGCVYLSRTTSQRLTRRRGLTPEEIGKAIAKRIEGHIRKPKAIPRDDRGAVPKVFKSFRRNNTRRRLR